MPVCNRPSASCGEPRLIGEVAGSAFMSVDAKSGEAAKTPITTGVFGGATSPRRSWGTRGKQNGCFRPHRKGEAGKPQGAGSMCRPTSVAAGVRLLRFSRLSPFSCGLPTRHRTVLTASRLPGVPIGVVVLGLKNGPRLDYRHVGILSGYAHDTVQSSSSSILRSSSSSSIIERVSPCPLA